MAAAATAAAAAAATSAVAAPTTTRTHFQCTKKTKKGTDADTDDAADRLRSWDGFLLCTVEKKWHQLPLTAGKVDGCVDLTPAHIPVPVHGIARVAETVTPLIAVASALAKMDVSSASVPAADPVTVAIDTPVEVKSQETATAAATAATTAVTATAPPMLPLHESSGFACSKDGTVLIHGGEGLWCPACANIYQLCPACSPAPAPHLSAPPSSAKSATAAVAPIASTGDTCSTAASASSSPTSSVPAPSPVWLTMVGASHSYNEFTHESAVATSPTAATAATAGTGDAGDDKKAMRVTFVWRPSTLPLTGPYVPENTCVHWACAQCRQRFMSGEHVGGVRLIEWRTGVRCRACGGHTMEGNNDEAYRCTNSECKTRPWVNLRTDAAGAYPDTNFGRARLPKPLAVEAAIARWRNYRRRINRALLARVTARVRSTPEYAAAHAARVAHHEIPVRRAPPATSARHKRRAARISGDGGDGGAEHQSADADYDADYDAWQCPRDGRALEHGEEGFVCHSCFQVYHACDTCSGGAATGEWMCLVGWKKRVEHIDSKTGDYDDAALQDCADSVERPMHAPPYLPEVSPTTGKRFIDDTTIWKWRCPVCAHEETSMCD